MLKTLTSKFTFFFWFIFFLISIPIYLFGTLYIKNIFQEIEYEKIQLMINTLKPSLALNLSFNQTEQLNTLLQTILKEKNIKIISLQSAQYKKEFSKETNKDLKLMECSSKIKDPFNKKEIATIKIFYSNENATLIYNKITKYMLFVFIFALLSFIVFYFYIKKELNILRDIAISLQLYSQEKKISLVKTKNTTQEIQTIATIANEMMQNISQYLQKLKSFNTQLEVQVKEKVQELQEQEKIMIHQSRQAAMGEMIESIAHQWRQPLNIIGLSCASLETEKELGILKDDVFRERLQTISQNINYMSNTIDDFRNFLTPNKELTLFSPKKTIEDVVHILQAQLKNNTISLTITEEKELQIYGIENEFKQVLFVLINNAKDAIKSTMNKEKISHGEIKINIYTQDEKNIISFCDNGGGIKEDVIHSIFNPYFTTKFASSGTGIGLYIAKNIIESRMEGAIYVKNTQNGCCFYIEQTIKEKEK